MRSRGMPAAALAIALVIGACATTPDGSSEEAIGMRLSGSTHAPATGA